MRATAAVLAALLSAGPLHAASPALSAMSPWGLTRGTEVGVTVNGARLADAQEILFYSPGLSATEVKPVNDGSFTAKVKIAADCRLGEHAFRVRTASGLSELRTITVGPFPVVSEKEPNNELPAANPVPLNTTVHGDLGVEDVDYFKVECKKGQRLSVEVEAMRLGRGVWDPYVAILDAKRFELAAADDSPLVKQDCLASVVVPADGTYYVQVRESSYSGYVAYRLHVGTFPRPTAAVPAGGRPGEEVEVTFLGDPAGPFKQKVKLPAEPGDTVAVPQDANGTAPSGFPFRVVADCPNVVEAGPNNSADAATKAPAVPAAFHGVIGQPGETDHFRFPAKKGQVFDVHCFARRIGSPLDPVMSLQLVGGGDVAGNDDAVGPDSYFRVTIPQDGEYALKLRDHLGKGGPTYFYRMEVTPVRPRLEFVIPKVGQYSQERQTVVVPRGNRYAALVDLRGVDAGGELTVAAAGLPAKVAVATPPGATGSQVPVVFEAAADAPLASSLVSLTGTWADPKAAAVPGSFVQTVELSTGGPGQSVYWVRTENRLAAAVAEAVPFKISVVEPKVPLVQNGSMNLRIVAERANGFKAPITVQMLTNPPGIGSASSATIPEGQAETTLFLNAAGNAPVRAWKFAVIGQATVGNGPVWVSSQLATLTVAQPYFAFNLERAAVEQGKATTMYAKVTHGTPFEGPAKVKLVGLPPKVTAPELEMTRGTAELAFPLAVDKAAPAGVHKNIFCQVIVMQNGEPVAHAVGGSELRIDVPLPPKPNAPPPAPAAQAKPQPAAPAAAPPKRLSRLEQLRLEQAEREKAGKK